MQGNYSCKEFLQGHAHTHRVQFELHTETHLQKNKTDTHKERNKFPDKL